VSSSSENLDREKHTVRLRVHRSDGKTGKYSQKDPPRAALLAKRFNPATLFNSGPIVIGVHNPFSILNPDEVCWIEIETDLTLPKALPKNVDRLHRLSGRKEYESLLARQWPGWMKFRKGKKGDPLEALIELSMRSGESVFLHVIGAVGETNLIQEFFGVPAIAASIDTHGIVYINPKSIVRARVYHSRDKVSFSGGFWMAEADDI
jgi:hypothetical protein